MAKFRRMAMGETIKIEAKMSYQEALKVLEIPEAGDAAALKLAYRKASMKHHPDKGGNEEMMKKVNEAYEVLQDSSGLSYKPETRQDREEQANKWRKAAEVVVEQLKKDFNPEVFAKYFEEKTGKKFTHKVEFTDPKGHGSSTTHPWYAGLGAEWKSEDKNTSFTMRANVDLLKVVYPTPSLGGGINYDAITYDMGISAEIFHENRKVKFKETDWHKSQLRAVLLNPALTFPSKNIEAMLKGKDASRKFSRRDALLGMEKKLDGKVDISANQVWVRIPMGIGFTFRIYRITMMNTATWNPHDLYTTEKPTTEKPREKVTLKSMTLEETEALLDTLLHVQKQVAKETDLAKIKHVLETELGKVAVKSANASVFSTMKFGETTKISA